MEIRKRFRLTLAEYTAFNLFHSKNRLIAIPLIFIVVMPVASMLIDLANYGYVDPMILISTLLIGIVVGAVLTLINLISVRHNTKKQYESSKAMQLENDIVINETGASESGEFGNTAVGWSDIFKVTESPSSYNIYFSRLQAFVIPKRFLLPYEEETLRIVLCQYVPPKKINLRRKR